MIEYLNRNYMKDENIENQLKLKIVFPDYQEIIYTIDVIKYWEYTDKELKEKKMYPLIPLQLFNLRKELEKAHNKNDLKKIKELSKKAKNLAEKLAKESAKLFEEDEILGEDFHKMLLAIQNLIEYLNRNYMKDENIENEVNKMTKTLYDPEVEKRGIEKGIEKGIKSAIEKLLLSGMDAEKIASILDVDICLVKEILNKLG
ncbi:hypothetical protein [uncultured Clostridium sp.]|uniref:hypothetical protein n=1 Tax=uncultured Clostridium sp. TaxID=59620 RepID=UPI002632C858|nr:hypothetical protein [uncultured Clostridium sp.]